MENTVTEIPQVSSLSRQVIAEVERAVVGKRALLEMMMASVLAGGHILLEDFPGLGKTLVALSFATALGLDFKRIQFTPDLLPGDITGGYIFNRTKNTFELRKGPIFANIVLADEINRASPKTQSALLEAMQEGQVTIEGETLPLPEPFHRPVLQLQLCGIDVEFAGSAFDQKLSRRRATAPNRRHSIGRGPASRCSAIVLTDRCVSHHQLDPPYRHLQFFSRRHG